MLREVLHRGRRPLSGLRHRRLRRQLVDLHGRRPRWRDHPLRWRERGLSGAARAGELPGLDAQRSHVVDAVDLVDRQLPHPRRARGGRVADLSSARLTALGRWSRWRGRRRGRRRADLRDQRTALRRSQRLLHQLLRHPIGHLRLPPDGPPLRAAGARRSHPHRPGRVPAALRLLLRQLQRRRVSATERLPRRLPGARRALRHGELRRPLRHVRHPHELQRRRLLLCRRMRARVEVRSRRLRQPRPVRRLLGQHPLREPPVRA